MGAVMVDGGSRGAETIILVHYICTRGEGRIDRVVVVNGVVDRVLR